MDIHVSAMATLSANMENYFQLTEDKTARVLTLPNRKYTMVERMKGSRAHGICNEFYKPSDWPRWKHHR